MGRDGVAPAAVPHQGVHAAAQAQLLRGPVQLSDEPGAQAALAVRGQHGEGLDQETPGARGEQVRQAEDESRGLALVLGDEDQVRLQVGLDGAVESRHHLQRQRAVGVGVAEARQDQAMDEGELLFEGAHAAQRVPGRPLGLAVGDRGRVVAQRRGIARDGSVAGGQPRAWGRQGLPEEGQLIPGAQVGSVGKPGGRLEGTLHRPASLGAEPRLAGLQGGGVSGQVSQRPGRRVCGVDAREHPSGAGHDALDLSQLSEQRQSSRVAACVLPAHGPILRLNRAPPTPTIPRTGTPPAGGPESELARSARRAALRACRRP